MWCERAHNIRNKYSNWRIIIFNKSREYQHAFSLDVIDVTTFLTEKKNTYCLYISSEGWLESRCRAQRLRTAALSQCHTCVCMSLVKMTFDKVKKFS